MANGNLYDECYYLFYFFTIFICFIIVLILFPREHRSILISRVIRRDLHSTSRRYQDEPHDLLSGDLLIGNVTRLQV